jgi:hypothetical protein
MASPDPPEIPPELAHLGTPLATFAVPRHQFPLNLLLGIPIFLFGVLAVVFGGFVRWHFAGALPLAITVWLLAFAIGFGSFAITVATTVVVRSYRSRGLCVLVFLDGLARILGEQVEFIRWADVCNLRQVGCRGILEPSFVYGRRLLIQRHDGGQWEFDEAVFPRLAELRRLVEEETLSYLLPPVLRACAAGEEVPFDSVTVTPEGLRAAVGTLPWCDVREATINPAGWLAITRRGGLLPWWGNQIAVNRHVLQAVIEYYHRHPVVERE